MTLRKTFDPKIEWHIRFFKSKSGPRLDGEEKNNISTVALDSVSSNVIKKMSQTEWFKRLNLPLTVPEAEKSMIKALADLMSGEDMPPRCQTAAFFMDPYMEKGRAEKALISLLTKA